MSSSTRSLRARRPSFLAHALGSVSILALMAACSGDASTSPLPQNAADAQGPAGGDGPTTPTSTAPSTPSASLIVGALLWVDPRSQARTTADAWRSSRPADAAQMDKLGTQAQARWFGNWNANVQKEVDAATTTITNAGALPVFVAYNIPQRDCGGLSGGNTTTADAYRSWIAAFADGIGARRAAVILEPDALAGMDCLSAGDQQLRLDLLNHAVQALRAKGSVAVYLDAGNPRWKSAATMADRLTRAGIAGTQGFALNVSNFFTTSENVRYGAQLSALVGGKHYVIDTSRSGLGPTADAQWCNPAGRALGERPTTQTGIALVDAFLWVKTPGESDGACSGAPAAGHWMPEYALGLAQRAGY